MRSCSVSNASRSASGPGLHMPIPASSAATCTAEGSNFVSRVSVPSRVSMETASACSGLRGRGAQRSPQLPYRRGVRPCPFSEESKRDLPRRSSLGNSIGYLPVKHAVHMLSAGCSVAAIMPS